MRILLVSECIPDYKLGGLGRHVVDLGNALIDNGHQVALMGRSKPDYSDCKNEIDFNGQFISGFKNPFQGWKEHQLGFFNPLKRSHFAKKIARAILKEASKFDVIHYHGQHPMVGKYIPKHINYIQSQHDQSSDCIKNTRFKFGEICAEYSNSACASCVTVKPNILQTWLSQWAVSIYRKQTRQSFERHHVIFVSEFLKRKYLNASPSTSQDHLHVIHNFLDEQLIEQTKNRIKVVDPYTNRIVSISGRLDKTKGIAEICNLLADRISPLWKINIIGNGPDRASLDYLKNNKNFILYGHLQRKEALSVVATSHAVIVPSLWEEPFGLVTLEALRLGKTCFALRRGGTPELAIYGSPGQLKLFDTLEELTEALLDWRYPPVSCGGISADTAIVIPKFIHIYLDNIISSKND